MTKIELFLAAILVLESLAFLCNQFWNYRNSKHLQNLKKLEKDYDNSVSILRENVKVLTSDRETALRQISEYQAKYLNAFSELEQMKLKQLKKPKRSSQSKDVPSA